MRVEHTDGRRSIGLLLRELAEGSASLVRQEFELVRAEVTGLVVALGRGTALVALGAVLALLGLLALVTGLVLLPGDQWLRDQYWLAALIVAVLASVVAFVFVRRGMHQLAPQQLAPDQTVATLKEDREWLKRQLT